VQGRVEAIQVDTADKMETKASQQSPKLVSHSVGISIVGTQILIFLL
jgi:hypothetical protein